MKTQAAIDQLLEPDTLDAIVENLAPEICKDNPTEECPAAVDAIIRQGLPLLAAAGDATAFGEVLLSFFLLLFLPLLDQLVHRSYYKLFSLVD